MSSSNLFSQLENYCKTFENEFHLISDERKKQLEELSKYIFQKQKNNQNLKIQFIFQRSVFHTHL